MLNLGPDDLNQAVVDYIKKMTHHTIAVEDVTFSSDEGFTCLVKMPPQPPLSQKDREWAVSRVLARLNRKTNPDG